MKRRYETGLLFLAPLVPILAAAASEVIGGVITVGVFTAVQASMTPRSEAEQQAIVNGIDASVTNIISVQRWLNKAHQLGEAVRPNVTGPQLFEAETILKRTYAFIGTRVSDAEREAAYHTARILLDELVKREVQQKAPPVAAPPTGSKGGGVGGTAPTTTQQPAQPASAGASGDGQSSTGTILVVAGVGLLAAAGIAWATSKRKGGRR